MELSIPAKTIIFHSLEKFDGNENRMIISGKFTQISGCAGK
jgi:superfamily II RNA helicase